MNLTDEIKNKYRKILNNLLDVKTGDASLQTSVDNTRYFDIVTKFGKTAAEKLWTSKQIDLMTLEDQDLPDLIKKVAAATTGAEIVAACKLANEKLTKVMQAEFEKGEHFLKLKTSLLTNLRIKEQKKTLRWKLFINHINDLTIQTNIYPLYIGAAFISLRVNEKTIYAPLLMREAQIALRGASTLTLSSDSEWRVNEKLTFILETLNIKIIENIRFENMSGVEALEHFKANNSHLAASLQVAVDQPFENIDFDFLKPAQLLAHSGMVLGLFSPSGGAIRHAMLEILKRDEINDIIEVSVNKNTYRHAIADFITKRSDELVHIAASNFSQDKALVSALIQDTIIFGPPGTGKSQVIANIIANIFMQQKTAIVMSQKKAALEVLKTRLGAIAPFTLFVLNNNQTDKAEFYKPLRQFVEMIENFNNETNVARSSMISNQEIDALKALVALKAQKMYRPALAIIKLIGARINEIAADVFKLSSDINYLNKIDEVKAYTANLATNNQIKKQGLIIKSYPDQFVESAEAAHRILTVNNQIDLNNLKELAQKTSFKNVKTLIDAQKALINSRTAATNERELAAFLSRKVFEKVNLWERTKIEERRNYSRFAEDVRAGISVPFKFLERHKATLKALFPIIISTPDASFIDWKKLSYDYAVVDEASQIQTEVGLAILHLAKIKILAGDNQQMKPTNWFSARDVADVDAPLEAGVESILDYAKAKGVHEEMLDQNYRSAAAALMSFSAKNFYHAALEVVDQNLLRIKDPIVVHNVAGVWAEGVNEVECKEVITIAKNNLATFNKIILLAFNAKQKDLLEETIIESEPTLFAALQSGKVIIRNIENIQGDEADLVIATIVYDASTNMNATYVARPGGKNALNVAISRAREQMIVVKSVTAETIKTAATEDFFVFREWLAFLEKPAAEKRNYVLINSPVDITKTVSYAEFSSLHTEVAQEISELIQNKNYKLVSNLVVGSKIIDLAVLNEPGESVKVGIMFNQYRYRPEAALEDHLAYYSRNDFLKMKGYKILTIAELDWALKKAEVVHKIIEFLK